MATIFHPRSNGKFIKIMHNLRRKKLWIVEKSSNFLMSSFHNRDGILIWCISEKQSQNFRNNFQSIPKSLTFYINSTIAIWTIKWQKLSFSNNQIIKSHLLKIYLISKIRFKFKGQNMLLPQISRNSIKFRADRSIIRIDSSHTDNIIKLYVLYTYLFADFTV